jgi:hypothetical protein
MAESLAEKVEWLFHNVPDPESGQPFTNPRLAARIRQLRPGFTVTGTAIWNVRTGVTTRPSWQLIEGMAKAFGVAPSFFSDDVAIRDLERQLAALDVLKDARVWSLAQRALGVSPESLGAVGEVLERYRELEGLNGPAAGADDGAPAGRRTSATGRRRQSVESPPTRPT